MECAGRLGEQLVDVSFDRIIGVVVQVGGRKEPCPGGLGGLGGLGKQPATQPASQLGACSHPSHSHCGTPPSSGPQIMESIRLDDWEGVSKQVIFFRPPRPGCLF